MIFSSQASSNTVKLLFRALNIWRADSLHKLNLNLCHHIWTSTHCKCYLKEEKINLNVVFCQALLGIEI